MMLNFDFESFFYFRFFNISIKCQLKLLIFCVFFYFLIISSVSAASNPPIAQSSYITTLLGGLRDGGGFSGDGGPASLATINNPIAIAVDKRSNVYILDSLNIRIRKVSGDTRYIETYAGTGTSGYGGDNQLATLATFDTPLDIAVDWSGNLYICDTNNHRVRMVNTTTSIITTVAGTGTLGSLGDGGIATSAQLNTPKGVATDQSGNVIISDSGNFKIRYILRETGIISTIAGIRNTAILFSGEGVDALTAVFNNPTGVSVDITGNVYIADTTNYRIRRVTWLTKIITTIGGNGINGYNGENLPATSSYISDVYHLSVDTFGGVYFAEPLTYRVRVISYHSNTAGVIQTFAGVGYEGYSGDFGNPTQAALTTPYGVAIDGFRNVYITESDNTDAIRVVQCESNDLVNDFKIYIYRTPIIDINTFN